MKFSPILFSTPMVKALIAGTKSQTRREIDINPEEWVLKMVYKPHLETHIFAVFTHKENPQLEKRIKFKWGKHYDILWVRETVELKYVTGGYDDFKLQYPDEIPFIYKADDPTHKPYGHGWKPSIHMPKVAARLFLEIQHISVERLNDIKRDDAIEEGIERLNGAKPYPYKHYETNKFGVTPFVSYASLWNSINGIGSWQKNPYVWVIEVKVSTERPKEFICT